jgi:hypothetical protein
VAKQSLRQGERLLFVPSRLIITAQSVWYEPLFFLTHLASYKHIWHVLFIAAQNPSFQLGIAWSISIDSMPTISRTECFSTIWTAFRVQAFFQASKTTKSLEFYMPILRIWRVYNGCWWHLEVFIFDCMFCMVLLQVCFESK